MEICLLAVGFQAALNVMASLVNWKYSDSCNRNSADTLVDVIARIQDRVESTGITFVYLRNFSC